MFFFFFFSNDDISKIKNKYLNNGMYNKEDIFKNLDDIEKTIKNKAINDNIKTPAYYNKVFEKITHFKKIINNSELLELNKDNSWVYTIKITELRAELYLKKINIDANDENDFFQASYLIISDEFNMLNVEEYANQFEVTQIAVRQWIRRGKLKASKRYGNEWKISEISIPTFKRNPNIKFHWENKLYDYPEEFKYINDYTDLLISQTEVKSIYKLVFSSNGKEEYVTEVGTQEKELLEMYLIGNVFVENDAIIIYE